MTVPVLAETSSPFRIPPEVLFRRAAGLLPSGVAMLSTADVTMTVSSLCYVSFEPPLISVALHLESRKGASIIESRCFHVRVLREGEDRLAKGEGIASGAGMVEMDATIATIYAAGDHRLVLASVSNVTFSDGYPVVYWRKGLHILRPRYEFLASRDALEQFIAAWENCVLPKRQWTHAGHVAVGAYYVVRYPSSAFERTRNGILRYNEAVGTQNSDNSGYHETLTRFWAHLLARFVHEQTDPWLAAVQAAEKFGEDRDLHSLYYSFDVVRSTEARRKWIPPDMDGSFACSTASRFGLKPEKDSP